MCNMGFDAKLRMNLIAEQVGGYDKLREDMRVGGFMEWQTASFYPIIAWFPKHMKSPDVLGIAVRNGYSFTILYGRTITPYDGINEWYGYVSLYDTYDSITEALLDHHKAVIATEVDFAEHKLGKSWESVLQEVIDGVRPTKFNINDDDFLVESLDALNFTDAGSWMSEHESFRVLFDALKTLGLSDNLSSSMFEGSRKEYIIEMSDATFDEDFQSEWA